MLLSIYAYYSFFIIPNFNIVLSYQYVKQKFYFFCFLVCFLGLDLPILLITSYIIGQPFPF
jgi:hypothetical protein